MLSSCEIQPEAYFYSDKITAQMVKKSSYQRIHNASHLNGILVTYLVDAYEVVHTYTASGIYTVVLSAFLTGDVDRAYTEIEILSPPC
jgi:hypothetical protein